MDYGNDEKSAVQARADAQKIAFGPIMFQAAQSLRSLGILENIQDNENGITLEEIANNLHLSVYGIKVLIEAGLSMELVYEKEDSFFLTKTGWFLLNDELTSVNMNFTHDVNYLGMFSLEESVKSGKPEGLKVFGKWDTIYEALAELPPTIRKSWFDFDHFYSDVAFPEILPIIFKFNPKNILDVGGNTGKFSLKCLETNSTVNMTVLDLPGQLNEAIQNIQAAGYTNRFTGHPLNLLDHSIPFPEGYDIVWMSQFLDCFSKADVVELLKRGKKALNQNGTLNILETYWDKQKFDGSTYSLHATSLYFTALANGCSQMYHYNDMLEMIDQAGLMVVEVHENIGISHTLISCQNKHP
ncbi:MAG: SAM-dependent methyltransferase [Planctomycetota bacterium]|nr:MAG: SAM-dependent methyltransferase [Planctomycetota bacterium]